MATIILIVADLVRIIVVIVHERLVGQVRRLKQNAQPLERPSLEGIADLRIDDHLALRRHQVALQAETRHLGEEFGTIAARYARLETGLFEIGGAVHDPARQARHGDRRGAARSEEHTSELQSLMRISYAVFCLKKNKTRQQ